MIKLTIPALPAFGLPLATEITIKYAGWGKWLRDLYRGGNKMGCAMATAKRRRRQAKMGWRNIPKQRRPHYATHTSEVWDRINAAAKVRQQALAARKQRKRAG